ncbi:MAG: peptide chain release factor N(5)-glutamine methyltransferase [Limisphaerales bacterium]
MTVLEVIQRSTEFLGRKGVDSPRLQIEILLGHVLRMPRLQLYLNHSLELPDGTVAEVRGLVQRRGNREPLQHLVGSVNFCGLEMAVSPAVLIPRPETEVLAEKAWQFMAGSQRASGRVLDVGTGSGCLAIAVAVHSPRSRVIALDVSPEALEVARGNVERHGALDRVELRVSDGLGALSPEDRFDLVMTNPPYVPSGEIASLQPEVRDFDPRMALDGGIDGLDWSRRLAGEAGRLLQADGRLMMEFGDGQAGAARAIFESKGWRVEALVPDLSGRERILVAEFRGP